MQKHQVDLESSCEAGAASLFVPSTSGQHKFWGERDRKQAWGQPQQKPLKMMSCGCRGSLSGPLGITHPAPQSEKYPSPASGPWATGELQESITELLSNDTLCPVADAVAGDF